jgi:DNA replication protein DnaC
MKTMTDNQHQKIQNALETLKLPWMRQNYESLHRQALKKQTGALEYLHELLHGEALARRERSAERRIKAARLPALKTLDTFSWQWPESIDRAQVEHLASLRFVEHKHNGVLIGPVGVGKTHLATAIALKACQAGHKVLYTGAVEAINDLIAAQKQGQLGPALRKYTRPHLLVLDEIGYLPIDKTGADLLFQIISARYERGALLMTTNKAFKDWPTIFNGDSTLTSAVLDRLLHHCETVLIKGASYRMRKAKQPA